MNQRTAANRPPAAAPVSSVLTGSRLFQAIDRLHGLLTAEWRESTLKKYLDVAWNARGAADRIRAGGWMAVSAAATHLYLVGVPAMMASPASACGWSAAGVFGLACIVRPGAVIAAWHDSAVRQHLDVWLRPAR